MLNSLSFQSSFDEKQNKKTCLHSFWESNESNCLIHSMFSSEKDLWKLLEENNLVLGVLGRVQ
jgi:hypothetical protein